MQDIKRLRPDLFEKVEGKYLDLSSQQRTASITRWIGYSLGGLTTLIGFGFLVFPGRTDISLVPPGPSIFSALKASPQDGIDPFWKNFDAEFEERRRRHRENMRSFDRPTDFPLAYTLLGSGLGILVGTALLSGILSPSDEDWVELAQSVEDLHFENGHKSMHVRALRPRLGVFPQWNQGSMGLTMGFNF